MPERRPQSRGSSGRRRHQLNELSVVAQCSRRRSEKPGDRHVCQYRRHECSVDEGDHAGGLICRGWYLALHGGLQIGRKCSVSSFQTAKVLRFAWRCSTYGTAIFRFSGSEFSR